eukprot:1429471-Rhodomonas_salina.1
MIPDGMAQIAGQARRQIAGLTGVHGTTGGCNPPAPACSEQESGKWCSGERNNVPSKPNTASRGPSAGGCLAGRSMSDVSAACCVLREEEGS